MIDGLIEGTADATLVTAGAAITNLLFPKKEAKQEREAPRKAEPAERPELEEEPANPEEEGEDEQPTPTDEDDEPEETEPAKPEPRKLRVKVNGEEQELPEDEVVKGYSRTADYTRKTQELAKERDAFKSEADAVRAERQQYTTQLKQLEELLTDAVPAEPDWDTLRNEDPTTFAATHAAWELHQKRLNAVKAERTRVEQKAQADRTVQFQEHLKQEAAKLAEAVPAWKDAEVAKAEKAEIADYARSLGFTDEDLGQVADHRLMLLLRDAMSFRKAEKNKPAIKDKIEKARVLTPDNAPPKRTVSELTRKKEALAKTHSLRDAGDAITELLRHGKF